MNPTKTKKQTTPTKIKSTTKNYRDKNKGPNDATLGGKKNTNLETTW